MQEEIQRQKAEIADLVARLEQAMVEGYRAERERGNHGQETAEFTDWNCRVVMFRMYATELKSKIVAGHTRLARLKLEAEVDRIQSLGRSPTRAELNRLVIASSALPKMHRRRARRTVRRTCDIAVSRIISDLPTPTLGQKQPLHQQQEVHAVPKQQELQQERRQGMRR